MNGPASNDDESVLAEGLRAFARRGDRHPAEFFVGRQGEIAATEGVCAQALAAVRGGGTFVEEGEAAPGVSQLFQGAPGAGKSNLLVEMARRWTARAQEPAGAAPLPVRLPWSALRSEEDVVRRILRAMAPELEKDSRTVQTDERSASAGFGGWLSAALKTGRQTAPARLAFDELAKQLPPKAWTRPAVLLIDEIQQADRSVLAVLNQLHLAEDGLPIVPVLAGLGSSRDRLREIGLSRFTGGAVRPLEALDEDEVCEALDGLFTKYRVDCAGAHRASWEAWLADRSDGWPQHLYNAMSALAVGLADAGRRLADVDFPAVDEAEARRRVEEAYRPRVSTEMKTSRFLLAAVMERLPPKGADIIDIAAAIEEEASDKPGWRIPGRKTTEEFLSDLVHQGVLQAGKTDLFRCPIPSLRRWLAAGMPEPPAPVPPAKEPEEAGPEGASPADDFGM